MIDGIGISDGDLKGETHKITFKNIQCGITVVFSLWMFWLFWKKLKYSIFVGDEEPPRLKMHLNECLIDGKSNLDVLSTLSIIFKNLKQS